MCVCFLKLTIPGECIMSGLSSVMSDVILPTDEPLRPVPMYVNIRYPYPSKLSPITHQRTLQAPLPTDGHSRPHNTPIIPNHTLYHTAMQCTHHTS